MCGFAAVIAFSDNAVELQRVNRMGSELIHRGPDDEGIYIDKRGALAFRRLSILDLSPAGHQPMLSSDGSFAMVFNGEIYNYLELRQELELEGWQFRSSGDAEVLLIAYLAWGESCLQRLNGMYAFVILDTRSGNAFAARDRAGIKPLFYARTDRAIFIASEPKALVVATGATLDEMRLSEYLCAGRTDSMDISAHSYFKGIYSLEAACALSICHDGSVRRWLHWEVPRESAKLASLPDSTLVEKYRELFKGSVLRQMRSDVPIGVTLSGGVDSSSVACIAQDNLSACNSQKLTYFCFHSSLYDESRFRDQVVARSKGRAIIVEELSQSVVGLNRRLIGIHDEPLHSVTALANAELYRAAQDEGIKVLLGGQGADELLAGYPVYRDVMLRQIAIEDGWLSAIKELNKDGWIAEGRRGRRFLDLIHQMSSRRLRSLGLLSARVQRHNSQTKSKAEGWLTPRAWSLNFESLKMKADFEEWDLWGTLKDSYQRAPMPDYLRIEDRNSMAYGIEARVPFLDDDLVNFAFALPARSKMRSGLTKYIHRAAMRGLVPDALLDRPDKYGFPVDQFRIFTHALIQECFDVIEAGSLQKLDLIDFQALKQWVKIAPSPQGLQALFAALQATLLAEHARLLTARALVDEHALLGEIALEFSDI